MRRACGMKYITIVKNVLGNADGLNLKIGEKKSDGLPPPGRMEQGWNNLSVYELAKR